MIDRVMIVAGIVGLVVVLIAGTVYLFADTWMASHGLAVLTKGQWYIAASGWGMIWELWKPILTGAVLFGLVGLPLGALLRGGAEQLEARVQHWDEQRELAAGRQAAAQLPQALARIRQLEKRLQGFETLAAREQAVSQAEARAQTLLAETQAQAQAQLAQAQREARHLSEQAYAKLQSLQQQEAIWKAELTTLKRAQTALKARQQHLETVARRIQRELRQAKQEGRAPDLALLKRSANRLLKSDPEVKTHEQAGTPSQRSGKS